MSPLVAEMDRVITGIDQLNRQTAYAGLEAAFASLRAACETLTEAEVSEFVELVHLVLLQFPRGSTIRVSGPKQPRGLDVCLKYNDTYEAALHRTMEFLARNLLNHLEKYDSHQYLHAALRALGKEYYRLLSDSYRTESIPDESALPGEDETSCVPTGRAERPAGRGCGVLSEEALTVVGPEPVNPRRLPESTDTPDECGRQMFLNWFEGNLSRCELTKLYATPMDGVDRTLLEVARTYEEGRHYGLVKWLVEMGEDGDIIWLLSKDMTAADVGQKIQRNQWVVYKHREAILKRLAALGLTGDEGRAVFARMLAAGTSSVSGRQAGGHRTARVGSARLSAEARSSQVG